MNETTSDERIKEAVRQTYGDIARRFVGETAQASCCGPSEPTSCCGPSEAAVENTGAAAQFYSAEEIEHQLNDAVLKESGKAEVYQQYQRDLDNDVPQGNLGASPGRPVALG